MPSKYEITRNAAQWLKTEVLSSQGKYLSFLRTAARNYKYSFVEQLLIHEQKPAVRQNIRQRRSETCCVVLVKTIFPSSIEHLFVGRTSGIAVVGTIESIEE